MNILLLEDELSILSILDDQLNQIPGVKCHSVCNIPDAINLILSNKFDMIFLDLVILGKIDHEFLQWVRSVCRDSHIVAMTAWLSGRKIFEKHRMDSYLPKPFMLKTIRELVISKNKVNNH